MKDDDQLKNTKLKKRTLHLAKLTEEDVRTIRHLRKQFWANPSDLAKRYNVTLDTIRNILKRKTWKDV